MAKSMPKLNKFSVKYQLCMEIDGFFSLRVGFSSAII